ncbi:Extracellular matrix protein FRAS1 [Araneus ventricosus]|uniref:Extracellular matrix protein FRAS1 n=1 Tax=Araneus ventricosus TaxID=182803 RepID=A0A4Y2MY29_ARAVE|nr:Extracellular matrix protein FRAS1 [Araneus ventricosus]
MMKSFLLVESWLDGEPASVCYETCEICYGSNDTDCSSCKNPLFIKNGKCVPHCSNGFFQDNGVCYACHPSCATCYGFNVDECYTCPFGRTFKYGKCIPSCKEGEYMNLEGVCISCHESCSDCLLNSTEGEGFQCLQCKNQQMSILYGECVVNCPPNFYLNSYQICQECHPTCATCERSGATSCVTCWSGNYLTHLGTCEAQCHQGYFPSKGFCQVCSPNCHHCISASECLQCKGDLVLQFGECLPLCSDQHYIDGVSRQCTECSRECNTCRGPSASDCTSCVTGKFFQDGSCVSNCSDGFFKKGIICEPCDLKCKTCSSSSRCITCDFPLLLRDGECVDDCGTGQYADYEILTCKPCSPGCAFCLSPDECGLCRDGYHLQNFACMKICPENYFEDPVSRICKRNFGAPSIIIDNNLRVQAGSSILITTSVLNASHIESEKLYIVVHNLPQNSQLQKMSDRAEEIRLKSGDNFTSKQLEDGWVFFKYFEGMPLQGDLVLKVSDGYVSSSDIILPMQIISKFPPQIGQLDYIVVSEESLFVINPSILAIEDKDNIADVTLNIIKSPCSGKLVLMPGEKVISSVAYEEFAKGQLAFKSAKTNVVQEDSFVIQAFDGFNSRVTDLKVIVLPKNSSDLVIVRNKPFYVKSGEPSRLTNDILLSVGENLSSSDIMFTIKRSANPSIGQIFKKIENLIGMQEIKGEKISFTQADIDNGIIHYNNYLNGTSKIKIKVENKNTKSFLNFDFEVLSLEEELENSLQANQYGMMVLQNHPAIISSDRLSTQVNGISPNDVVYMITKKLLKEEGFLENLDQPGIRLQSFTQNDIDTLKIVYHPPPYGGASEKQFMFQFVVIDARSGSQLSPVQNFTITVTPPKIDFTSPASSIDHRSTILVTQGQSVKLEHNWLTTEGHELSVDQLEVVLTNAPQHGVLVQMSGDNRVEIQEEDGFAFTSIINDAYYEHDGSNNFHDSAVFSIMGGRHSTLNRVLFEISPNDRESPVILDSTTLMGSVTEDTPLFNLTVIIEKQPDYGFIENSRPIPGAENDLAGIPISAFPYIDLVEGYIKYMQVGHQGVEPEQDTVLIYLTDGRLTSSQQLVNITIRPMNDETPHVFTDILSVPVGGYAKITNSTLSVVDADTTPEQLIITLDDPPKFGVIKKLKKSTINFKHSHTLSKQDSFSFQDVLNGLILYVHEDFRSFRNDSFAVIASDGHHSLLETIHVIVIVTDREVPFLVRNLGLELTPGNSSVITNEILRSSDSDSPDNLLTYSITTAPTSGQLLLFHNGQFKILSSDISGLHNFTQEDIDRQYLKYQHNITNPTGMHYFKFNVKDPANNILIDQTFFITISGKC